MLTGDVPFPGDNVMEKLMGRITTVPPSVSALRAEAHSDLDELVANLLRTNPSDRPQSPGEVAEELDRLAVKIRRHESRIANLRPVRITPHSQLRSRLRRS
jgi:serine/threonine protein kinase